MTNFPRVLVSGTGLLSLLFFVSPAFGLSSYQMSEMMDKIHNAPASQMKSLAQNAIAKQRTDANEISPEESLLLMGEIIKRNGLSREDIVDLSMRILEHDTNLSGWGGYKGTAQKTQVLKLLSFAGLSGNDQAKVCKRAKDTVAGNPQALLDNLILIAIEEESLQFRNDMKKKAPKMASAISVAGAASVGSVFSTEDCAAVFNRSVSKGNAIANDVFRSIGGRGGASSAQ